MIVKCEYEMKYRIGETGYFTMWKNSNTLDAVTHLHVDEELDDAPQTDKNAFKKLQVEG